MNKREQLTIFEEFLRILPAMALFLILLWAGVQIYNATHPEQFSTEKKDLIRFVNEIKDLRVPQGNVIDTVTVPLFSRDYLIIGLNMAEQSDKSVYPACSSDYCACLLNKDGKPVLCETFNLRKDFDQENICKKDGKDYKGVSFDTTTGTSTNSPVTITRKTTSDKDKPCLITITN